MRPAFSEIAPERVFTAAASIPSCRRIGYTRSRRRGGSFAPIGLRSRRRPRPGRAARRGGGDGLPGSQSFDSTQRRRTPENVKTASDVTIQPSAAYKLLRKRQRDGHLPKASTAFHVRRRGG